MIVLFNFNTLCSFFLLNVSESTTKKKKNRALLEMAADVLSERAGFTDEQEILTLHTDKSVWSVNHNHLSVPNSALL